MAGEPDPVATSEGANWTAIGAIGALLLLLSFVPWAVSRWRSRRMIRSAVLRYLHEAAEYAAWWRSFRDAWGARRVIGPQMDPPSIDLQENPIPDLHDIGLAIRDAENIAQEIRRRFPAGRDRFDVAELPRMRDEDVPRFDEFVTVVRDLGSQCGGYWFPFLYIRPSEIETALAPISPAAEAALREQAAAMESLERARRIEADREAAQRATLTTLADIPAPPVQAPVSWRDREWPKVAERLLWLRDRILACRRETQFRPALEDYTRDFLRRAFEGDAMRTKFHRAHADNKDHATPLRRQDFGSDLELMLACYARPLKWIAENKGPGDLREEFEIDPQPSFPDS